MEELIFQLHYLCGLSVDLKPIVEGALTDLFTQPPSAEIINSFVVKHTLFAPGGNDVAACVVNEFLLTEDI